MIVMPRHTSPVPAKPINPRKPREASYSCRPPRRAFVMILIFADKYTQTAGDDSHLHVVPAGNLQSPTGTLESREESRHVQYSGEEEGTTMGCNKFWGKFSCEAIRALPTFRPGSNRIANLLSNRIGTHRYLPCRHYGKPNILDQYIRRASWTFYGILYALNIGPTIRRRKIHQY